MRPDALDPLLIVVHRLEQVSPADQLDTLALITAMGRRAEEAHGCALCPCMGRFSKRARFALTVGPDSIVGPMRWLDLCPPCHVAVHVMHAQWPGNEAVLARYQELEKEGLVLPLRLQ